MGCSLSSEVSIDVFNNYTNIAKLRDDIKTVGLVHDMNINIYIDGSQSNMLQGGSSLHSIPNTLPLTRRSVITNPYIYAIDALNEITDMSQDNKITMNFFGTVAAQREDDLLEPVNVTYNYNTSTVTDTKSNIFYDINDSITGYVGVIKNIQNNKNKYGNNSSIIPALRHTIKYAKNTNRFTVCYIITDGVSANENEINNIKNLLIDASHYPIAIIMVCVSDLIDNNIRILDKTKIKGRQYDNFRVVSLYEEVPRYIVSPQTREQLIINLFSELPQQYKTIQLPNVINYKPNTLKILNSTVKEAKSSPRGESILVLELNSLDIDIYNEKIDDITITIHSNKTGHNRNNSGLEKALRKLKQERLFAMQSTL